MQYVYVDMDLELSNFESFILNLRMNYNQGLMLEYKVVYLIYTTQELDWHRLGQQNGSSILRPN